VDAGLSDRLMFGSDQMIWPEGDPKLIEYGVMSFDSTSSWTDTYHYYEPGTKQYEMAFGKRPEEELYNVLKDPECLNNLALNQKMKSKADSLYLVMRTILIEQKDPRETGNGDIFESYPRYGSMKDYLGGFSESGKYNSSYSITN
jgi:uncharacterized sulfatase